mmetsp:Transcript_24528/g.36748  ORF Transcript_24528/g.36748 Transcript_24528/m.36748 type:complete len:319 (-) Transcript_24528:364-1320(-)
MTLQWVKVILFMLFFVLDLCVAFTINLSALRSRRKAALTPPNQKPPLTLFPSADSSTQPGESILIFGGTKALGQLVTKKLRQKDRYCLRVSSRVTGHAEAVLDDDAIEVVELDFVNGGEFKMKQNLQAAVDGVSAVVIITGTAVFPKQNLIDDDIPHAIEAEAVEKLAQAAVQAGSVKKVVLVSSIGVERRKSFPFNALNIFGVLDATRKGEGSVIAAASDGEFDYAIIRPGRLIGGPYSDLDFEKMMTLEGGADNGLFVEAGDTLIGECKLDACAEAIVQCLENPICKNLVFCAISSKEKALTNEQWTNTFKLLSSL